MKNITALVREQDVFGLSLEEVSEVLLATGPVVQFAFSLSDSDVVEQASERSGNAFRVGVSSWFRSAVRHHTC